jgi:hypothetical protein
MTDKNKRKSRRASQVFLDLPTSQEALLQNEQLVSLYQNKNFQAPTSREFETIYEDSKRGLSEDGSLVLGKSLGKRFLETYKYWKQDDRERVRRRKLMIQKQFKGRKRLKVHRLTACMEEKLIKLIDEGVGEEEEEEAAEEYELWLHTSLNRLAPL